MFVYYIFMFDPLKNIFITDKIVRVIIIFLLYKIEILF